MKKRILSLVMAVVLAVSLVPAMSVTASAANLSGYSYISNSEATNTKWELNGTTLTITPTNETTIFSGVRVSSDNYGKLGSKYFYYDAGVQKTLDKSSVKKIIVNSGVTYIAYEAIYHFPNLTEIEISGTSGKAVRIRGQAFQFIGTTTAVNTHTPLTITLKNGSFTFDDNAFYNSYRTTNSVERLSNFPVLVLGPNYTGDKPTSVGTNVDFKDGKFNYQIYHAHTWTYSNPSANQLNVTCTGAGTCTTTNGKSNHILTISASGGTYNGSGKTASIANQSSWSGIATVPTIYYEGVSPTVYSKQTTAPKSPGTYKATITAGGKTASVNFTIAKANLSPTVTLNGWTYGGTANNPSVSGNTGNGAVTYTYKAQGAEDSTYTTTKPTNAGNYTVKASIAATTNYNAATATKAFTIAKANATLTAPTANNRTYDGSEQALVTAGTNVVGGTLKYRLDGGNYSENIPTATNAGTYTVHYKVFGDDNYNDTTEASVPVTIAKADPTVTPPTANNRTYNGTEQALVTADVASGGTLEYSTSENGVYSDAIPTATDAGEYTVWYKAKGDLNHNDTTPDSVDVTIAKADATDEMQTEHAYLYVSANRSVDIQLEPLPDEDASYGEIEHTNTDCFTLSDISAQNMITATCVTTTEAGIFTQPKTFTIPVTGSKNYEDYTIEVTVEPVPHPVQIISFAEDEVPVTFREAYTVTATNDTANTNGNQFGYIKYRVLDEDGGQHVVSVNENTGELTTLKVGTAIIAAEAMGTAQYAPSEPRYITVHVAPKTLTEDMLTLGTSEFPYDGSTSREPDYTVADGSTTLTHGTDYGVDITSTTSAVNAGTYTIKIDGIGNYTGSVEKTWEIQKVKATVTAPTANDRTYDGTEQALVNAGTDVVGGTLKYRLDGGEYDTDIPTATNAGTYSVWYKVEGDDNHNDTTDDSVEVTIAKATPDITTPPTAEAITYGQTLSDSTLTGGVASTDGSFAWKEPGTAPVVSDSGTTNYTVVFTPDDTTNYETVECNATLTVNKKPVAAVIGITAPKAKETAQTELAATDDFKAATITWSPELKDGKFEYNKEYTATVTLELKDIYNTTIDGVTFTVDGAKADGVTINGNTLKVVFTNTGSAPGSPSNSITAPGSAENGEVSVDKKSASAGQTVTITVTPDKGYTLETLTVTDAKGNEVALTKVDDTTYTFKMPNGKVNVDATFMEDNTMLNYFVDVPVNEYYYDAVLWAVSNGITNGTDDTHFSPNMGTTRAHVVTFLWRAAGCPEPKGDASQFTDVVAGEYYEKAVAWAIENGITKGTSATTFSPDAICTRGQIVTFLARFAGVKDEAVGYTHGFTDVNAADYFNNAVAWAKDNKITEGTTATTFSPYEDCTRAQVVTFLYRLLNK